MRQPNGVIAAYCHFNDPALFGRIYASDFGAASREPSSQRFSRQFVAGWETRNLGMAASICEALLAHPGGRLLTIVGAWHNPCFEAYLRPLHNVEVVDTDAVLR